MVLHSGEGQFNGIKVGGIGRKEFVNHSPIMIPSGLVTNITFEQILPFYNCFKDIRTFMDFTVVHHYNGVWRGVWLHPIKESQYEVSE